MPLYEMSPDAIRLVPTTSFAQEGLRERLDIQRLLRDNIDAITQTSSEVYVLAEEFGGWEDSRRRIDLLCLDRAGNLVVVELKRDETGAHMELQALRYAAMVSAMSMTQVVDAHAVYLRKRGDERDPQLCILEFLGWTELTEGAIGQTVRVILASADFSKELTTTVMWLNKQGLDIRCVRLQPYRLDGRVLLDVQQVIPLPEAEEYQVRLREKEREERSQRAEGPINTEPDESILGRVTTDFLRRCVTGIEQWVDDLQRSGHPEVDLRHGSASRHFIRAHGKNLVYYTFAETWLYCMVMDATPEEISLLESRLTEKQIRQREGRSRKGQYWFHVLNDEDLAVVKEILVRRLESSPLSLATSND
jgi:hypothetical protein